MPGRLLEERRTLVEGLGRGLPEPQRILEELSQRLDDRTERLGNALRNLLRERQSTVARLAASLPHPRQQLSFARERLQGEGRRLGRAGRQIAGRGRSAISTRLEAVPRLRRASARVLEEAGQRWRPWHGSWSPYPTRRCLARGFALVHGPDGVITRARGVKSGTPLGYRVRRRQ